MNPDNTELLKQINKVIKQKFFIAYYLGDKDSCAIDKKILIMYQIFALMSQKE